MEGAAVGGGYRTVLSGSLTTATVPEHELRGGEARRGEERRDERRRRKERRHTYRHIFN